MTSLGQLVAAGRTSDVYHFGAGAVVKVPRRDVPDHWAPLEAEFTMAVRDRNVPVPAVIDVTEIDGRQAVVFERIEGRSMWDHMVDRPADMEALTKELAATHRLIFAAGPPAGLHGAVDRIRSKLAEASQIGPDDVLEAGAMIDELPRGAALLHGDLHPGNVLMSRNGPVVIDWFDASIGHPVADIVRSSLLMRPFGIGGGTPHLPGADDSILRRLHETYLAAMSDLLEVSNQVLRAWEAVSAASRLSEGSQPDGSALVELWRSRRDEAPSPLLRALSAKRSAP